MKTLARQFRRHWQDILAYFDHPYTNAILEGANSIIQHVKTRARGFGNMDCFSTMIYLACGRLDPKNSHRLTGLTHTKQRKALIIPIAPYRFRYAEDVYSLYGPMKREPLKCIM